MKAANTVGKPRIGLVGYGYWGPNLLRNLVSHGGCEVVGVVEASPEARVRSQKVYPQIPTFENLTEFLSKVKPDAMVIATPPSTHASIGIECMEAGAHILVEKPLAMSSEESGRILEVAAKTGRKVMVDHTFAFHPAIQYLADQVRGGNLGDLLYYDSVRVNLGGFQPRTNVLWDLGPHDLSILDVLTGGKTPTSVSAVGTRHFNPSVESLCYVHLAYPDNFVAHLHLNWAAPIKIRNIMLGGSRKMAVYDENMPTEKVKIYDKSVSLQHSNTPNDFKASYRVGDMIAPAISNKEALAGMVDEFVGYIRGERQSVSDGLSGARVVQILEAAGMSLEQGGAPIALDSTPTGRGKLRRIA